MDSGRIKETAENLLAFSIIYTANKKHSLAYLMAKAAYRLDPDHPDLKANYYICKDMKRIKGPVVASAVNHKENPTTTLALPGLVTKPHSFYGYEVGSRQQIVSGYDNEGRPIIENKVQCKATIPVRQEITTESILVSPLEPTGSEYRLAYEPYHQPSTVKEALPVLEMGETTIKIEETEECLFLDDPNMTLDRQPSFFSTAASVVGGWLSFSESSGPAYTEIPKEPFRAEKDSPEMVITIIMTGKTVYQMLEISPTNDLDIVSKASKKALLVIHPDKNSTDEAKVAYSLLNDELIKFREFPAAYFEKALENDGGTPIKISQPGDSDFNPSRWRSRKEGEVGPGKSHYPASYSLPNGAELWAHKISTGHGEDGATNTFASSGKSGRSKTGTRYMAKNRE